jgi:hypothetical protein
MERMYGVMELIASFQNIRLNRKQFPEKTLLHFHFEIKIFHRR